MPLDSKQKRGSIISLGHLSRQWLAEPSGALPVASRISLLRLSSARAQFVHTFLHGVVFAKPSLGGKIRSQLALFADLSGMATSLPSLGGRLRVIPTLGGDLSSEPTLQDKLRANR